MRNRLVAAAVAVAAIAIAAVVSLLRAAEPSAPATEERACWGPAPSPPSDLAGVAPATFLPPERSLPVEQAHDVGVRAPPELEVTREWTVDVVDEQGRPVDPMGLLRLVVIGVDGTGKWITSMPSGRDRLPSIAEADKIECHRCFSAGSPPSATRSEDTIEVRAAIRSIRVVLRGWRPVQVVLPRPDEGMGLNAYDTIVLQYPYRDVVRLTSRRAAWHAIPVRVPGRVEYGHWIRATADPEKSVSVANSTWTPIRPRSPGPRRNPTRRGNDPATESRGDPGGAGGACRSLRAQIRTCCRGCPPNPRAGPRKGPWKRTEAVFWGIRRRARFLTGRARGGVYSR